MQPQLKNRLGLDLGQAVALVRQAELGVHAVRAGVRLAGSFQHARNLPRLPQPIHERDPRVGRRRRRLDQLDDLINVCKRDGLAFQNVSPVPRFPQVEYRPAGNHLAPMSEEGFQDLLEVHQLRLTLVQRNHVDAEDTLHRRLFVQIVQDDVGDLASAKLDHDTHAVLVGLVTKLGDALYSLVADQVCDLFNEASLIHLVGQLGDDDGLLAPLVYLFNVGSSPDIDAAPTGPVRGVNAGGAVDEARCREIGPGQVFHQARHVDRRIFDQGQGRVNDLAQVVRRDVRGHADRNTRRPVDQQVRDLRRHDTRFALGTVVVLDEVDRLLLDVGEKLRGNLRHAHFGVTHGRRRVAIDRAKVALPIHEQVAHRERLGHANDRVVDRRVPMRVIFTNDVTNHSRRLLIRLVVVVTQLAHGVQHASVNGLETVPDVGQRPADDDTHRIVEIGLPHLVFETDRE